jgi:CRP/FNR family transcriptional regulator, cyclic AMP receptor protein
MLADEVDGMRKALYILGSLDDRDIEWMARSGTKVSLSPGEILIREGKPIEFLYILIEGQLSVRTGKIADKQIAVLLPGEIVGEISFVDNRKPTASVLALQDSRLLALPRSELTMKLARDSGFASRFYRAIAIFLADRLFTTTSRLGYGSPDQDRDADAIEDSLMDEVSLASIRFDNLLKYLTGEERGGSFIGMKL